MTTMRFILLVLAAGLTLSGAAQAATGNAAITGTQEGSEVSGAAVLIDTPEGLKISVRFTGVLPGKHGFHIHQNGACGDEGKEAGGHYNPTGADHGLLSKDGFEHAHAGDFGNVEIDQEGSGQFEAVIQGLSLAEGEHVVANRAFILHEKEDDFSQPTGNAGGRIGCGVIQLGGSNA